MSEWDIIGSRARRREREIVRRRVGKGKKRVGKGKKRVGQQVVGTTFEDGAVKRERGEDRGPKKKNGKQKIRTVSG